MEIEPVESISESRTNIVVPRLSRRQFQILPMLARGMDAQDIAEELNITTGTARNHILRMYLKLRVNSAIEAVLRSWEIGIMDPSKTELGVSKDGFKKLTPAEERALMLLDDPENPNPDRRDVADKLVITRGTLNNHILHAKRKLGVQKTMTAVLALVRERRFSQNP